MIYGQSGGGSKVTTLLGMPAASGLIHRAAAQSGGGGNIPHTRAAERGRKGHDEGSWTCGERHWRTPEDGLGEPDCCRQCGHYEGQSSGTCVLRAWSSGTSARWMGAFSRREEHHNALVLRGGAGGEQERSHPDRLGIGRGQQYELYPNRDGMACRAGEDLWRRKGKCDYVDSQGQLSAEADRDAVLHVQWPPWAQRLIHAETMS